MNNYYFFRDNKADFKQCSLVDAIGIEKYCQWKGIDKLFRVIDALSATDFVVHIYSDINRFAHNSILVKYLMKHFGIDDLYIGTIYCISRGIEFDVHQGQWRAYQVDDRKDRIYGYGPTILMAISNLHYELSVSLAKTFIP